MCRRADHEIPVTGGSAEQREFAKQSHSSTRSDGKADREPKRLPRPLGRVSDRVLPDAHIRTSIKSTGHNHAVRADVRAGRRVSSMLKGFGGPQGIRSDFLGPAFTKLPGKSEKVSLDASQIVGRHTDL